MASEHPKVFISYSHDSDAHTKRVRALADKLRADGVDASIDQYIQDPNEGWIRWMRQNVKQADKVLLTFTETYQRRFEGDEEEAKGLGATFEGVIVTQVLYDSGGSNAKFRPVVFEVADQQFIPDELRRFNHYRVDTPKGYEQLLRWLYEAPSIVAPTIGHKPDFPPEAAPELFPSGTQEQNYRWADQVLEDKRRREHQEAGRPDTRQRTVSQSEQDRADNNGNNESLYTDAPSLPTTRLLRVFAFDAVQSSDFDVAQSSEATIEVRWEELQPGPVGEYIEVVDVDPATGVCYAPVDLNQPAPLSQAGFAPSRSSPQFHQQMVYVVAMKTIERFEYALGRVVHWAPRFLISEHSVEVIYVHRLRIYPHALRECDSFYSPLKKALLLGYCSSHEFKQGSSGRFFCALSHDMVTREVTYALLDGLHRHFSEPTNPDVPAFIQAFAEIVALFQHFTVPEALCAHITRMARDSFSPDTLGVLAVQFGQRMCAKSTLRSAIGSYDEQEGWRLTEPNSNDYSNSIGIDNRAALLVAAIFDGFLQVYRQRSKEVLHLADSLADGQLSGKMSGALIFRLAEEASTVARKILHICIRALDYCPPVNVTFGDYLRALVTADRDLVPRDKWGFRAAIIKAFARRGMYPEDLPSGDLCWKPPTASFSLNPLLRQLEFRWSRRSDRRRDYQVSQATAFLVHRWLSTDSTITEQMIEELGVYPKELTTINGEAGKMRNFEVHPVFPVRRLGPDGQQRTHLIIEITQTWRPTNRSGVYRGGCTMIIDLEESSVSYVVRKRVGNPLRMQAQDEFQAKMARLVPGLAYGNR
jgi:hypothetical protein